MHTLALAICLCVSTTAVAETLAGAEYRWSTQTQWEPQPPPRPDRGGLLLLRVRVPELGPMPTACIPFVSGRQRATLDGAPLELPRFGALVTLPPDAAGRLLEVEYDTFWARNLGVSFGSRDELLESLGEDASDFAFGLALLIVGVVAALAAAGRFGRSFFFFGAFCTCIGLMKAGQSWGIYPLALPFPAQMVRVHELTVWWVGPALGGFVVTLFPSPLTRWLRWLGWAGLSAGGLVWLADLLQVRAAPLSRPAADVLILLVLGLSFGVLVPKARRADTRARVLLAGMAAQFVFAVPEILHGLHIGSFDTAYLGTLALVGCMGLTLRQQYAEATQRLLETTQALKQQLAALDARQQEVTTLNAELRYQVAERSRELARSLATAFEQPQKSTDSGRPDVGAQLGGRYRLGSVLGGGAMGTVHRAERLSDGLSVAVKLMHSVRDSSDVSRFAREAEIAARVSHPNLVAVLDIGVTASNSPFLVMELVPGGTLAERAATFGQLDLCLRWLMGIARALEALHAAGVVHRDLKPSNVLLGQRGEELVPLLSDFGISRLDGALQGDDESTQRRSDRLTRTGAFLGTPMYMAPEQATHAATVGPSADVFSFGVLAYEVLTTQVPWHPPAVFRVMAQAPIPAPPLRLAMLEGLEPAIGACLDACLSLDANARPTAATLSHVLDMSRRPAA